MNSLGCKCLVTKHTCMRLLSMTCMSHAYFCHRVNSARQKVWTDLDEALTHHSRVYRLDLSRQRLKTLPKDIGTVYFGQGAVFGCLFVGRMHNLTDNR